MGGEEDGSGNVGQPLRGWGGGWRVSSAVEAEHIAQTVSGDRYPPYPCSAEPRVAPLEL